MPSHWREWYIYKSHTSQKPSRTFRSISPEVSKNGVIIQSVDIVSAFPSVFTGFEKLAKFFHRPRVKPEVTHVSQGLCHLPFSVREEVSREKDEPCKSITDDCVMEVELDNLVTPIELKAASSTDVTLTQVRHFIQNGWPRHQAVGLETYFRLRDELSVFDDLSVSRGIRAVIPTSRRQQVLHISHQGHPGIVRTKQRCRITVWWPAIDRHIETFLRDCEGCAVCEKSLKPTQPPLQPIPWPEKLWQHIQIDIFGEVQAAPLSQRFLVVVRDVHSKWPEIAATTTVTCSAIIQILKELFSRWGIPELLQSDNGPQFVSYEFKMFLQKLGIVFAMTF